MCVTVFVWRGAHMRDNICMCDAAFYYVALHATERTCTHTRM